MHALESSALRGAALGLFALACSQATKGPAAGAPPVGPAPAPAATPAATTGGRQAIAKLAMGDAVIAVYASDSATVDVGASAPGGTMLLHFLPSDVEAWATATTGILAKRARVRRGDTAVAPTTLAEPGVTAGALTFERSATRTTTTYTLFFADRHFGGFPVTITKQDARVLIGTLQHAATVAARASPRGPDRHTPPYTSRAPSPGRARADSD